MTLFIAVILIVLSLIQAGWAQIGYNANTNSLRCSKPGGHYCVNGSLQGPTMVSCISTTTAEIRSCNIELANILPPGYEDMAICYETAPILGDALCAFNGTGYPLSGKPISIPETAICTSVSSPEDPEDFDSASVSNNEQGAIDNDPTLTFPKRPDHKPDAARKRAQISILGPENPEKTTTRPDNEKGSIQTIPDMSILSPVFSTSSADCSSTLTTTTRSKSVTTSLPTCVSVSRVGSRDPNTTLPGQLFSSDCVSGSASVVPTSMFMFTSTLTPTPTPTLRRPRLGDLCAWTPTPMYRTGAGVVRSSSSSWSASSSSSASETSGTSITGDGKATETSVKVSGASSMGKIPWGERLGFAVLVGWIAGLGVVGMWV